MLQPNYESGGGDEEEPKIMPEVESTDIFAHQSGETFAPEKKVTETVGDEQEPGLPDVGPVQATLK